MDDMNGAKLVQKYKKKKKKLAVYNRFPGAVVKNGLERAQPVGDESREMALKNNK